MLLAPGEEILHLEEQSHPCLGDCTILSIHVNLVLLPILAVRYLVRVASPDKIKNWEKFIFTKILLNFKIDKNKLLLHCLYLLAGCFNLINKSAEIKMVNILIFYKKKKRFNSKKNWFT